MKKIIPLLTLTTLFALTSCTPPSDIIIGEEEKFEDGATEISMWLMDFEEWENQINISQRKSFNSKMSCSLVNAEESFICTDVAL